MMENIILGRYNILNKLFTKDIAEYYLAEERDENGGIGQLVTIKRLLPALSDIPNLQSMLAYEAKLGVLFDHPNIVKIYKMENIDTFSFIIMEYIDGQDLKSIISQARKKKKPLPIEISVKIISEICKGLSSIHNQKDSNGNPLKIVHLNIVPSNIIVSYTGETKLDDFSEASSIYEPKEIKDFFRGNIYYSAPELLSKREFDHKADIFSLGVILWELVTGKDLFSKDLSNTTIEKIKSYDIQSPCTVNPYVPEKLEKIILKALSKSPSDRFESAQKLEIALEDFLKSIRAYITTQDIAKFLRLIFEDETGELEPRRDHLALNSYSKNSLELFDISESEIEDPDSIIEKAKTILNYSYNDPFILSNNNEFSQLFSDIQLLQYPGEETNPKPIFDEYEVFEKSEAEAPSISSQEKIPNIALLVTEGNDLGKKYYLTPARLTIGRVNTNNIYISDPEISRRHAEIIYTDGNYVLIDCGSANGCYLNGERVTKATLKENDKLLLGKTSLTVIRV